VTACFVSPSPPVLALREASSCSSIIHLLRHSDLNIRKRVAYIHYSASIAPHPIYIITTIPTCPPWPPKTPTPPSPSARCPPAM
jgi:hypothetical protein